MQDGDIGQPVRGETVAGGGGHVPAMVPGGDHMGPKWFEEPMTCPECLGSGYLVCETCEGEGTVESKGDDDE